MMERKRALTIPFALEKDKLIENPLRIPTSYLECERFEQQVSWTAIAGHKSRRRDSRHKNGAVLFDHNHAAMVRLGLAVRKPRLILTDVLKTDVGKVYMEKIKRRPNGKERRSRGKDPPIVSRDRRSSQTKNTNVQSKSLPPKIKQSPNTSRSSPRYSKKAHTEKEDDGQEDDDVVSGENGKVELDCGLSLSWEQENHCSLSKCKAKETSKEPKKTIQQKRKTNDTCSECPETDSPKRPRASVLRLSGVVNMDGEPTIFPEKEADDKDSKNADTGIVQFTVGGDIANAETMPPVPEDNGATTDTAEPIVLSSDEEDGGEKNEKLKPISQRPLSSQQKPNAVEDMQVFQLPVNDQSDSMKETCLYLSFTSLHCGPYQAKANGDILITDENIIIPLKDTSEEMDLMLTLERKQLKRYSVWEKHELETLKCFSDGNKALLPAAGLLCCVSEAAAEGVQYDLTELCDKQDSPFSTGNPSPFILIFLQESLEGIEGAFLRSLLDMDCLNSLTQQKAIEEYDQAVIGPLLSLEESWELIKSSGLDHHLLQFLEQKGDCTVTDIERESTSNNDPDIETANETALEPVKEPECEKPAQEEAHQPKENPILSSEKTVTEPAYTLCHQQLEDSYSVTMCKADSSWAKYKHQGLTRRLIQFPPPPLKGGITVTMEDLQCLDIGQYLNDVIIDFYLKYLLQNASKTVFQRSHIFSSFFYKQLTRRDNASEGGNNESCQRQKRYQRVRTWTRHVDIFSKDFIFVPVNQEAHWYLVVICFPGLEEPKTESLSQNQDEVQGSECPNADAVNTSETTEMGLSSLKKEDSLKDPGSGSVNCTEQTCQRKTILKRPCILVMDSLKRSPHERVFKLMREYLQSEWEARRGSLREFGSDQMESSNCQVPLQDNSSDCGLYLLHYVESFLKDPVVHFDLPLHLKFWFPRHQVRRKREEIRDLVLKLYRLQNMDIKR